jgi:hypothetical protein
MEQAYQCFLFYKANPPLRSIIASSNWKKMFSDGKLHQYKAYYTDYSTYFIKKIVYPDWDFTKFQAAKPTSVTKEDKDFWLYTSPELKPIVDRWRYYFTSQLDSIDDAYLTKTSTGTKLGLRSCITPVYHIGSYDNV